MKQRPVAIITGASRGIGKEVAVGLAKRGFRVALMARNAAQLDTVCDYISQTVSPDAAISVPANVSDHLAVEDAVADVVEQCGRVDLLFNNAGIFRVGSLEVSVEELDRLYQVNLRGAFSLLQSVVPIMKQQQSGQIINLASISGTVGYAGYGAYASSKFGLVGLGQALFKELAPLGIKVSTICPSWVNTDMAEEANPPMPPEEMIQPQDIMKTVEWLLDLSLAACPAEIVIFCRASVD